jgi:hypothetical protein
MKETVDLEECVDGPRRILGERFIALIDLADVSIVQPSGQSRATVPRPLLEVRWTLVTLPTHGEGDYYGTVIWLGTRGVGFPECQKPISGIVDHGRGFAG